MTDIRTNRQKTVAILVVAFLFILVGLIFAGVGIFNYQTTMDFRNKIHEQKKQLDIKNKLDQLFLNPPNFDSEPKSYLVIETYHDSQRILAASNSNVILPIASITKLMTAVIVIENLDLTQKILADSRLVGGDGTFNNLKIGELYTARDLLISMLVASDNDSAKLLADKLGEEPFVSLMNNKAKELHMDQTHYLNVTGLDPIDGRPQVNTSTANDLFKLIEYIQQKHPEIFQITLNHDFKICTLKQDCNFIKNTNKLFEDKSFNFKIWGTKTGQTDLALKNLALITEPINDIFLTTIVLGSNDHFADTKTIFNNLIIKNNGHN